MTLFYLISINIISCKCSLILVRFRVSLVGHFKQLLEHFKQTNTFFHPHLYQKHPNNITQTPLPNTPLMFFSKTNAERHAYMSYLLFFLNLQINIIILP